MSVLDSVHYDKVSGYAIGDFSLLSRRFSLVFFLFFHRENKVIIYVKIPIFGGGAPKISSKFAVNFPVLTNLNIYG